MTSKIFVLLSLVLAATANPLQPRQDAPVAPAAPTAAAPKAAKGGSWFGSKGSSSTPKASGGSSDGGSAASSLMNGIFGGSLSSSEIKVKGGEFPCKKACLIFARGTGEAGNMGYVVGPGLGTQLKKAMNGDILLQGADYSTDFSGSGAKDMVATSKLVLAKCPDMKIVLGGYSQGAMQVHQALGQLGTDAAKIAAAVTFGDPYSTMGWGSGGIVGAVMGLGPAKGAASGPGFNAANGAIFCSTGDAVCGVAPNLGGSGAKSAGGATAKQAGGAAAKPAGGAAASLAGAAPLATPAAVIGGQIGGFGGGHLSYASDGSIAKAVAFIVAKVGGASPPT